MALALGCGEPGTLPCDELDGAPALSRVSLVVADVEVSAEIARTEPERSSAWSGRRCELDAVLWIPPEGEPAAVTLCGVVVAVDLAFVRDNVVVEVERERSPCASPCEMCPAYGERVGEVDAVLWFVSGAMNSLAPGVRVDGLAEALPPPSTESSTG